MIHIDLREPAGSHGGRLLLSGRMLAMEILASPSLPGIVVISLVALTSALFLDHRVTDRERILQTEAAAVSAAADSLGHAVSTAAQLKERRAALDARLAAMSRLDADPHAFVRLMAEVARSMPHQSWLDLLALEAFNSEDGEIEFRVRGFSPSAEQVAQFQRALDDSDSRASTAVESSVSTSIGDTPLLRFDVLGRTGRDRLPDPGYALENEPSTAGPRGAS